MEDQLRLGVVPPPAQRQATATNKDSFCFIRIYLLTVKNFFVFNFPKEESQPKNHKKMKKVKKSSLENEKKRKKRKNSAFFRLREKVLRRLAIQAARWLSWMRWASQNDMGEPKLTLA